MRKKELLKEQYKFYKFLLDRGIAFMFGLIYLILNINTKKWVIILISSFLLLGFALILFLVANNIHNKWMGTLGGEDWREKV